MPKLDAVSRRKFIAVGGGTSLAAFLAACGGGGDTTTTMTNTEKESEPTDSGKGSETEQFGKGDIGILNYALTLEYLEAAFYKDVVKSGLFKGEELAVLKKFGAEEQQHVEALSGTVKKLGGKPADVATVLKSVEPFIVG
jgi:Ferritin-like domain